MSINEELKVYNDGLLSAYNAVVEKGGETPENKNLLNLPNAIKSVRGGGVQVYMGYEEPALELGNVGDYYLQFQGEAPYNNIYEEISYYADLGEAQERYPVGTMIDVNTGEIVSVEVSDHLTMRITGYDGVIQDGDSQKTGRPQLQAVRVYQTTQKFGSAESTAQTEWRNCSLRTWLNDTYLNTLPDDFKNAIKTSIVTTCPNGSTSTYTTNDSLYLYSASEVGGVGSGVQYAEAPQQEYYAGGPSNNLAALNGKRVAYTPSGAAAHWWLRTALQGDSYSWYVETNGTLSNTEPNTYAYVRPCCNL